MTPPTSYPLPSIQLAEPAHWSKGSANYCGGSTPYCMMAAVSRHSGRDNPNVSDEAWQIACDAFEDAKERLKAHLGVESPFDWNDLPSTTHAEVIVALKACDL